MRKLAVFFLLATVVAPSFARPNDTDNDRPGQRQRSAPSATDSDNGGRSWRAERTGADQPRSFDGNPPHDSSSRRSERPQLGVERSPRQDWRTDRALTGRWRGDGTSADQWRRERRLDEQPRDTVADWRAREAERAARNPADAGRNGSLRERWGRGSRSGGTGDGAWDGRRRQPYGVSLPRPGTQPPIRIARDGRDSTRRHWRGDWRNDRRYDWRNYRERNRSTFRLGVYFDPFGWNYQRYNVGWRLWPDYYSSNYWINDPWQYRLPAAYPGTRWIRYHDDALLVDTWSGEVMDVIHNFFW